MALTQTYPSALAPAAVPRDALAPVRAWLWICAALVLAMVVVGGATRLTESGLSITEWKPVTGVLPPLSDASWQVEFEKYKRIPQYAELFPDMDLMRFKSIFFWEWSHRLLGRVIGIVFAVPLGVFWLQGRLSWSLGRKLVGVLALGGLQGTVGWWMVQSGLSERVEVSQYRLAVHLLLASLTLGCIVALAASMARVPGRRAIPRLRVEATAILALTFVQIGLGALVAGLRAGLTENTWPLMGDRFVPPASVLGALTPWWSNLFENVTTVQFDHRMAAYTLFVVALAHAFDTWWTSTRTAARRGDVARAATLAGLVSLQAGIGITTLLLAVPLWAALAHQAVAMLVLGKAVLHQRRLAGV